MGKITQQKRNKRGGPQDELPYAEGKMRRCTLHKQKGKFGDLRKSEP